MQTAMNNVTTAETIERDTAQFPGDVSYTVRDPRPEAEYAILAGPFAEVETARHHQQLHNGSKVFREELF